MSGFSFCVYIFSQHLSMKFLVLLRIAVLQYFSLLYDIPCRNTQDLFIFSVAHGYLGSFLSFATVSGISVNIL